MKVTKTKIAVRFNDIDLAGHVHNSVYLSYFEQGRLDFLTDIAGNEWDWRKKGLVIGRNEIDYFKPVYLTDDVFVVTQTDHVGNKSFTLSYLIYKIEDGVEALCSSGRSILVCMDYEKNVSVPVFDEWKDQLMECLEV